MSPIRLSSSRSEQALFVIVQLHREFAFRVALHLQARTKTPSTSTSTSGKLAFASMQHSVAELFVAKIHNALAVVVHHL